MEEFQFDELSLSKRKHNKKKCQDEKGISNLIMLPSILKVVITQKYTLSSVELRVKGRQVIFNNE